MARVVRRRNNPPILLIVFVFLFVIAAALAVLMYMQRDEATKSAEADIKLKRDNNTTIKRLESWNAQMAAAITGRKGKTTKAALSQVDSTYAMLKKSGRVERDGLVPTILSFDKILNSQKELVNKRAEAIKVLQGQLADKAQEMKAQKDKLQAEIDKWVASHTDVRKGLGDVHKQRTADKAVSKKKYDSMLEAAESEKVELLDEHEKMIEQASRDKREIRRLKKELADIGKDPPSNCSAGPTGKAP